MLLFFLFFSFLFFVCFFNFSLRQSCTQLQLRAEQCCQSRAAGGQLHAVSIQANMYMCTCVCMCMYVFCMHSNARYARFSRFIARFRFFACSIFVVLCFLWLFYCYFIILLLLLLLSCTVLYRRNWPTTKLYHKPVRLWLDTRNNDDSAGHLLAACCRWSCKLRLANRFCRSPKQLIDRHVANVFNCAALIANW